MSILFCLIMAASSAVSLPEGMLTQPTEIAAALSTRDLWVLAPPKALSIMPNGSLDIASCSGAWVTPENNASLIELTGRLIPRIEAAAGFRLKAPDMSDVRGLGFTLLLASTPVSFPGGISPELFEQLGSEGYVLQIDNTGATLAARETAGLNHAITTLTQLLAGKTTLPYLTIIDWPSLKYRGAQQDISRGQVPTTETLARLAETLAESKSNVLELYIEHVYKWKAYPDISPPEGLTFDDARAISARGAAAGVEVHPLMQALGHSYFTLKLPQYQHLRVSPSEKAPWIMTFDIRKPEAVEMVRTQFAELCDAFPGKLFAVDITEIDLEGLQAQGVTVEQVTDLVYDYVLKLNETAREQGRRLIIAQGPLDSQGHLAGMGPKLDILPKDIIIGSYYCAGGPYKPAYEKDFPRMREKGIDFFAQAWIYSHSWITPWVTKSYEFSDLEVGRGAEFGAMGSITTDWGDAGHAHFVGEEWLPFLYHGACAWSGANMDKAYFRKAYARIIHGLPSDEAVTAIENASSVNSMMVRVRDKEGKETEISTGFIWEFVHDPFTHPDITRYVDPAGVGQKLLDAALPAQAAIDVAMTACTRNKDVLEQWLFGVRCYAALGRKLIAVGHANDPAFPKAKNAEEFQAVADDYTRLQEDFKRLWTAENHLNTGYDDIYKRMAYTIVPCRQKAAALLAESNPAEMK